MMLVVDLSGSQYFGAAGPVKSEIAAEISAVLAFLAINHNDRVRLLLFSDRRELYLPPQKGRRHVLQVIREILNYQPAGRRTDLKGALVFTGRILKHRSIVFLISDFFAPDFEGSLQRIARRHDTIAIHHRPAGGGTARRRPGEVPGSGERGRSCSLNLLPSGPGIAAPAEEGVPPLPGTALQANKVDYINISTARPYIDDLQKFFTRVNNGYAERGCR